MKRLLLSLSAFLFMAVVANAQTEKPMKAATYPGKSEIAGEHGGQIVNVDGYTLELIRKGDLIMVFVTNPKVNITQESVAQASIGTEDGSSTMLRNIHYEGGFFRFPVEKNLLNGAVNFEALINNDHIHAGWVEVK